jgi:hypothetical protein
MAPAAWPLPPAAPPPSPQCAFQRPLHLSKALSKRAALAHRMYFGDGQRSHVASNTFPLLASAALPMEPQASSRRRQWFEGWFFRLVDHATSSTVAVIFGSLRKSSRSSSSSALGPFDEHLIVLAYNDGRDGTQHMQSVRLDGDSVRLGGGGGGGMPPRVPSASGAHVSWWSDAHGGMQVNGDAAVLDLRLPSSLRLNATIRGPRVAWDDRRPDHAGPEGWLSRTGLLPCHYFVHSFGSPTSYSLWHGRRRPRLSSAAALAHIERNWGDSFPSGWVWAQATATDGRAFLILTGGRFVIGPLTTDSFVIGLRASVRGGGGEKLRWDFRTTDLDRVAELRDPCAGRLALNATSRDGRRRLELLVEAPPNSFGERIMVPTVNDGFSDNPGCRESHVATARVGAWETRTGRVLLGLTMPLAVLEFGGGFQC